MGPGHNLFDYIATSLHTFMEGHQLEGTSLPLGFTFSFPLIQVFYALWITANLAFEMPLFERKNHIVHHIQKNPLIVAYLASSGRFSYRSSSTLDQRLQMLRCGGEKLRLCKISNTKFKNKYFDTGRGCGGPSKAGSEKTRTKHWGLILLQTSLQASKLR